MKLRATIDDESFDVELEKSDGQVTAFVNGRQYDIEMSRPEPGILQIKNEGRIYEARVEQDIGISGPHSVTIKNNEFVVHIADPKRLRGIARAGSSADGIAEIRTAMHGKVVRILLDAGSEVGEGDAVLIIEAMKMQNELRSPKAGVVKEIRVEEGMTVAAGDVLATIE
jgi:biotin carboxyl carrier protein